LAAGARAASLAVVQQGRGESGWPRNSFRIESVACFGGRWW